MSATLKKLDTIKDKVALLIGTPFTSKILIPSIANTQ